MLLQPLVLWSFSLLLNTSLTHSHLVQRTYEFIKSRNRTFTINYRTCRDSHDFAKLFGREYQVTSLRPTLDHYNELAAEHQLFVVDLKCAGDTLQQADNLQLFRSPFTWLLWNDDHYDLGGHYFTVDSSVNILSLDQPIRSVYKLTPNGNLLTSDNRSNLQGLALNLTYVVTNPITLKYLDGYRFRHIDAITRLNYILVQKTLLHILNATADPYRTQPTWGYRNSSGYYSGLAGDLQLGLSDIGATPMFLTSDRLDILDYVAGTTPTFMKFIFKAPSLSYVTNIFTLPFDTRVWHCCFALFAIVGGAIYVIVQWEWRESTFRVKIENYPTSLRGNFFDVLMMEIGGITQQGSDVEPKSIGGRIAMIFTFLVLMFLYTAYCANIVALLQSTTDSIRTVDDLLTSRIKLGVEDIVYAHYYFENAKESTRKAIYEQKIAPKNQKPSFMSVDQGMRLVQRDFFAFHTELSSGYRYVSEYFEEKDKCGLSEVEYVNLFIPYLTTRKRSPYKELVKVGMRRIQEAGIQKREIYSVYYRKPVCHSKGSNFGSVGLIDCYPAFLFFGVGIGISVALLVAEVVAKKISLRKCGESL